MKKAILALALLLALVTSASTEVQFKAISVTSTSKTINFAPSSAVMICNLGANAVFFRLFVENDIVGAATTSYGTIAAGSSTAPVCMSFSKSPTNPANFNALSIICDTGLTATAHVYYQ